MVKLTKIYTRTGDAGKTHLAGGHRVSKTSLRISAIGDVDELNSWFGLIACEVKSLTETDLNDLLTKCHDIQQQLFNLGAQVAILNEDRRDDSPQLSQANVDALEQHIDQMNETLPTLTSFILPGGNRLSATMHISRSVCRRAERTLFELQEAEGIDALALHYLNRLSDWLFVAARFVCHKYDISETLWTPHL